MNEWMNEWINKWMNEWMNELTLNSLREEQKSTSSYIFLSNNTFLKDRGIINFLNYIRYYTLL